jgi:hypothetical protein
VRRPGGKSVFDLVAKGRNKRGAGDLAVKLEDDSAVRICLLGTLH